MRRDDRQQVRSCSRVAAERWGAGVGLAAAKRGRRPGRATNTRSPAARSSSIRHPTYIFCPRKSDHQQNKKRINRRQINGLVGGVVGDQQQQPLLAPARATTQRQAASNKPPRPPRASICCRSICRAIISYAAAQTMRPKLFYSETSCAKASFISAFIAGEAVDVEIVDLHTTHKTALGEDFYKINPKGVAVARASLLLPLPPPPPITPPASSRGRCCARRRSSPFIRRMMFVAPVVLPATNRLEMPTSLFVVCLLDVVRLALSSASILTRPWLSPNAGTGNVPALVLDDGTLLNEGSAVLQAIAGARSIAGSGTAGLLLGQAPWMHVMTA